MTKNQCHKVQIKIVIVFLKIFQDLPCISGAIELATLDSELVSDFFLFPT